MKFPIALVALLNFPFAFAQENSAPSAAQASPSEIEKFSYIAPIGVTYSNLGFAYTTSKGNLKGPAGTVSDYATKSTNFNYAFGYGISEYLTLGLKGTVLLTGQTDYDYGIGSTLNGTSESYKRSGWQEPEIGAIWRIRNNEQSKMRINLTGSVKPKLQTAKYATTTSDGNNGIGGTQMMLGLGFFKEVKDVEFQFQVSRKLQTVAKAENASDSNRTTEADEHQSTELTLGLQGIASDQLSIGGNLVYDLEDKYSTSSFTGSTKTGTVDYDSASAATLELIGKMKIESDSMIQLTLRSLLTASVSAKVGTAKLDQRVDSGTQVDLAWIQEF